MEKLKQLKKHFNLAKKSSLSMAKILQKLSKEKKELDDEGIEIYHDSMIKRFELTYETFWKYLKVYLSIKHGIDVAAPKDVFRTCLRLNITNSEETNKLLEMVDSRNLTTHLYDQEMAHEVIIKLVPSYLDLVQKILEKTAVES